MALDVFVMEQVVTVILKIFDQSATIGIEASHACWSLEFIDSSIAWALLHFLSHTEKE